ncbi:MAG: hypothetical protein Q9180_007196, partial [Flavoplaca navasiana]
ISDPKAVGKVELDRDIEVMRDGLPERRVWFAGEHTAPVVALGTVTGAWWSGEGVAKRILKAYGLGGEVFQVEEDGSEEIGEVGTLADEDGKVAVKRGGTGLGV